MHLCLVVPAAAKLTMVISEPLMHPRMRTRERLTRLLCFFNGMVAEILSNIDCLVLRGVARRSVLVYVGRPITVDVQWIRGFKNIVLFYSVALEVGHVG
jgi:hypothetical protein